VYCIEFYSFHLKCYKSQILTAQFGFKVALNRSKWSIIINFSVPNKKNDEKLFTVMMMISSHGPTWPTHMNSSNIYAWYNWTVSIIKTAANQRPKMPWLYLRERNTMAPYWTTNITESFVLFIMRFLQVQPMYKLCYKMKHVRNLQCFKLKSPLWIFCVS
jgi:hypothetical protein